MFIKTQGIVLKYTNLGEADKILTLLTRSKGKIKAIAKGCRKPKSSLLSSSELFTCSEFILYKGTSFYHITQAETKESFYNIRNELLRLSYASYFVELADTLSDEDIPSERLFVLLANVLYYLSTEEVPVGILYLAYQLKAMDISGYRPHFSKCVICGRPYENFNRFSIEQGGVVCSECMSMEKNTYRLSPGTFEIFKILLNTEISRLNTVKMDNTIFNEMDKIMKTFIQSHLEKHFKTLSFLEEVKNSDRF
jgi:DNA repair protein RecO (recombination protein O)